jgi:uncharacterized protein YbbC (DUF1343 family)
MRTRAFSLLVAVCFALVAGSKVTTGIERLVGDPHYYQLLAGRKVGIISNPTGVRNDLTHEVDTLSALAKSTSFFQLLCAFGPEHGFRGTGQAGAGQAKFVDNRTGITVYDAYAKNVTVLAEYIRDSKIDTILFDIQDVGTRFYTYVWTLFDMMCAAAAVPAVTRFMILDRPNPQGGLSLSGPILEPQHSRWVAIALRAGGRGGGAGGGGLAGGRAVGRSIRCK